MIVTLSLDSSEAAGRAEKPLLEELQNDLPGNSIAVGRSEKGAISHDKLMVVDGLPDHRFNELVVRWRSRTGQPAHPDPRPDRLRRGTGRDRPRPRHHAQADGGEARRGSKTQAARAAN
jgi:hypothetical protein